ncbi:hypothetical protein EVAR_79604_1 [Eumeta japonica]|uniref:Uncharacterized protein n=1 Tax=Eumeta variegata TaxID=151549 RepID=A0A4C1UF62_EUMVA|nr:hypothetical protein EVAR_79604_1 [Eumeta japonica]
MNEEKDIKVNVGRNKVTMFEKSETLLYVIYEKEVRELSGGLLRSLSLHSSSIRYPIYSQEANSALPTTLKLEVSICDDDHLFTCSSQARLHLKNAT